MMHALLCLLSTFMGAWPLLLIGYCVLHQTGRRHMETQGVVERLSILVEFLGY